MSWDVELVCDCCRRPIELPYNFKDGGTYPIGGTNLATLNITYNYSRHLLQGLGIPFENLKNMTPEQAEPYLQKAINYLGTDADSNYWEATKGNAGYALNILLKWVKYAIEKNLSCHFEIY
ncbi:hypothetical protein DRN98_07615 [Methanosarcinales archaeon]|nr:MAG: hypothetical protein DRN98_07615 [Methanosarcinales archaeon]